MPEVRRLGEQGVSGVKVLLLHGDSDTGMPVEASSAIIKELVPRAELMFISKRDMGCILLTRSRFLATLSLLSRMLGASSAVDRRDVLYGAQNDSLTETVVSVGCTVHLGFCLGV